MASERANAGGVIVEVLPNAEVRVELEDGRTCRCYTGGKLRLHHIRLVIGDRVQVVMPEGSAIGRVVRRL